MFFEPRARDKSVLPYDPFKALIAPRPIGWISSMNKEGLINLAPYSFFNAFSGAPPLIGFCSEGPKDSYTFAKESGEFVWNMATSALEEQVVASAEVMPASEKSLYAGLCATENQRVNIMRSLVSVHHFEIEHVAHDAIFITDAIAAQHIAGHSSNIKRLPTGVTLHDRRDFNGCTAFVCQSPRFHHRLKKSGRFHQPNPGLTGKTP